MDHLDAQIEGLWKLALEKSGKDEIILLNMDGKAGNDALELVSQVINRGFGQNWKEVDESGGDCFFATTHVMLGLINYGLAERFKLVTGIFGHKEGRVMHSWLQYRPPGETKPVQRIVVNVSNMDSRPVYAISREGYFRINRFEEQIQLLYPEVVRKRYLDHVAMSGEDKSQNPLGIDVRGFTKKLLRKTMYQAERKGI